MFLFLFAISLSCVLEHYDYYLASCISEIIARLLTIHTQQLYASEIIVRLLIN